MNMKWIRVFDYVSLFFLLLLCSHFKKVHCWMNLIGPCKMNNILLIIIIIIIICLSQWFSCFSCVSFKNFLFSFGFLEKYERAANWLGYFFFNWKLWELDQIDDWFLLRFLPLFSICRLELMQTRRIDHIEQHCMNLILLVEARRNYEVSVFWFLQSNGCHLGTKDSIGQFSKAVLGSIAGLEPVKKLPRWSY